MAAPLVKGKTAHDQARALYTPGIETGLAEGSHRGMLDGITVDLQEGHMKGTVYRLEELQYPRFIPVVSQAPLHSLQAVFACQLIKDGRNKLLVGTLQDNRSVDLLRKTDI